MYMNTIFFPKATYKTLTILIIIDYQDNIKFHLCDYRQLPNTHKYDRIISW